jgi:hypothetical protein
MQNKFLKILSILKIPQIWTVMRTKLKTLKIKVIQRIKKLVMKKIIINQTFNQCLWQVLKKNQEFP